MQCGLLYTSVLLTIVCLFPGSGSRHYDADEENMYRKHYLVLADEEGHYHVENLYEEKPIPTIIESDVTLYLYSQRNQYDPDIITVNNVSALALCNFNHTRPSVFVAHGWKNNYKSAINTGIRKVLLDHYDVNLFIVDWSKHANKLYIIARQCVQTIGEFVGDFINSIMVTYNVKASNFYLIGHSLGAHVAGCAGARVKVLSGQLVNSIVGLDPASPLFTLGNLDNRIDPSDADFVEIIHTNAGFLGFSSAIGDADFYPNGGGKQPGCGLDIIGTCSHSRSYEYFAESLLPYDFLARKCESKKEFKSGICESNDVSYMGNLFVDKKASGDYYLVTNGEPPYSMG